MNLPDNYKKYPGNVLEPVQQRINGDDYTVHGFRFHGLYDFYDFLTKNPEVNYYTFSRDDLSSKTGSHDFAGVDYDAALKNLIKTVDPGYQEFLQIQKQMKAKLGATHHYRPLKTVAGGSVDPVGYTTGSPEIYRASRLVYRPKFITIDTQIAYPWFTSKAQVFNRAVIITSLVRALERRGYNVDVNSFMVVECGDEIIKAIFEIKRHGQRMNYQTLYKSLVDVEFFRRLGFRVMEVSNVTNDWRDGYGCTSDEELVRHLLKLKKDDIYFDRADKLSINGKDIGSDFENAIENLELTSVIDVAQERKNIEKSVKVLQK